MTSGEDYDQFLGDDDDFVPDRAPDAWEQLSDARIIALAAQLGQPSGKIYHSPLPFYLGGHADVIVFPYYVPGMTYVTADLIGDFDQIKTAIGSYELMMCARSDADWAANVVSQLARYTLNVPLNAGDVMDFHMFDDSPIKGLLLAQPDISTPVFDVLGKPCGLLLCIGITPAELKFARVSGADMLLARLREAGVFPYTDLERDSVV